MKATRYIPLLLLTCMMTLPLQAQVRKLDDSGKKPQWAENAMEKGFIIGMSQGGNLKEAKEQAMLDVREQITEAVAVHVQSVSTNMIREMVHNQKSDLSSAFTQETTTQTAKRDYLAGISPSKAEAFYWEHLKNRQSDQQYYAYWLKYPFSDLELDRLVRSFKAKDRQLTERLNNILDLSRAFTSIEDLEKGLAQLQKMVPLFMDDRKNRAEVGVEKFRSLLQSVYIHDQGSKPGVVQYSLQVGDKKVTTSKKPAIQSNCAEIQNRTLGRPVNRISYDDSPCYEEPGNYIEVRYTIARRPVTKKFPVDPAAEKIEITLLGKITLHPEEGKIRFRIRSKYDTPLTIISLELNNEVADLQIYQKLDQQIPGKGTHQVAVSTEPFKTREGFTSAEVNGYIHYKAMSKGETKSLRIYRQEARITR